GLLTRDCCGARTSAAQRCALPLGPRPIAALASSSSYWTWAVVCAPLCDRLRFEVPLCSARSADGEARKARIRLWPRALALARAVGPRAAVSLACRTIRRHPNHHLPPHGRVPHRAPLGEQRGRAPSARVRGPHGRVPHRAPLGEQRGRAPSARVRGPHGRVPLGEQRGRAPSARVRGRPTLSPRLELLPPRIHPVDPRLCRLQPLRDRRLLLAALLVRPPVRQPSV